MKNERVITFVPSGSNTAEVRIDGAKPEGGRVYIRVVPSPPKDRSVPEVETGHPSGPAESTLGQ